MDFIKTPLHKDGIALLKAKQTFMMEIGDGKKVMGKVENGLQLITQPRNLCLHLKGDILCDNYAHTIFQEIIIENYYGKQIQFLTLTKPKLMEVFAFLKLATKEARNTLLACGNTYDCEKIKVRITRDKRAASHRSSALVPH